MIKPPYYPVVYVRGYAGSQSEVEDTVADPYMGFNKGSTKVRQRWNGDITRHIFESPLVRLMKDYGYRDIYLNGQEIEEHSLLPDRSVWIYRYYEPVSKDLGEGERPEIEDYAKGLADFLASLRYAYTGGDPGKNDKFRVYLVAHSMGGLVVRCFLQNISKNYIAKRFDPVSGKKTEDPGSVNVDKVFTYATPHRGIDFRLIGNIPRFLSMNNMENFNRGRMRKYLAIEEDSVPINSLNNAYDPNRFFCLVGTDSKDYEAARGLSRHAVGPLSDGLVQIMNAYVDGSPRAFVHRSHSGHYGIVNSESGYQNMVRFFFGDLRVDGKLLIKGISLPKFAQDAKDKGKNVRASYVTECTMSVRAASWDLHSRTAREECAILCKYDSYVKEQKSVRLFSGYLSKAAIASSTSKSMMFAVDIGIQVPNYEIDGRRKNSRFIKGGYIFRDKLNLRVISEPGGSKLFYGWDRHTPNEAPHTADLELDESNWQWRLLIETENDPKLVADLILEGSAWNNG